MYYVEGRTPLFSAVEYDQVASVKLILNSFNSFGGSFTLAETPTLQDIERVPKGPWGDAR